MKNIIKLILSLGDASQDYMVLIDKNLKVAWVNKELEKKGFKKVKGKNCKDVFKSKEQYCDFGKVKKALDKNQVIKYEENGFHSSTIPINVNDHSFVLVVSRDTAEKKKTKTEINLEESEERYRSLIENSHDIIQWIC